MNRLRLRLRHEIDGPDFAELVPVVDGRDTFDGDEALGLHPAELLAYDGEALVPADSSSRDVLVARCGCGESGCGWLTVRIARDGAWSSGRVGLAA